MEPFSPELVLREVVGAWPPESRGGVSLALTGSLPSAVLADRAAWVAELTNVASPGRWGAALTAIDHQGRVEITYRLGQVRVTFVAEVSRAGIEKAPRPLPADIRVLVADDDPAARSLLSMILGSAGARVVVAEDGQQAVDVALSQSFGLIFLDMHMPRLEGPAVAMRLRNDGIRCPILAITANSAPEDQQECLEAGMNDVVHKPIRRAAVLAAAGIWAG